jgi:hypothetical protein
MIAFAATLVGCSRQPPHQAATESCTDGRQFACLHRTVNQPIELASLKTDPSTETRLKSEKPRSLRIYDKAAHFVAKRAKTAGIKAKAQPSATRVPLPPRLLRTQVEPKSSVAAADPATTAQRTVGLVPNSNSRTIQEQVAAATVVAERVTAAALASARDDVELTEGWSPNKTNPMVAIVMARPEIGSVADLAGKDVAIDERYFASSVDVWIGFVMAGARSVELSAGNTTAINRLVNGEVPAAVLTVVSADSAEGFPDIAGFKVFRVPLMRPSKVQP